MSEDKKSSTAKRFAILSKDSIKAFGESAGHSAVSDEVASLLAEDAVYRLREVMQVLHHCAL
jgi:transcription initiation factor TFIID subunit 6